VLFEDFIFFSIGIICLDIIELELWEKYTKKINLNLLKRTLWIVFFSEVFFDIALDISLKDDFLKLDFCFTFFLPWQY